MVFVPSWSSYSDGTATLSRNVSLPTSVTGDRVWLFVGVPSSTVTTPAGWTAVVGNPFGTTFPKVYVFYRDGPAGSTVTVATAASIKLAAISLQIDKNEWANVAPEVAVAQGTSTTPDPPSVSPSWGSGKPSLFAALYCATTTNASATSAPTSPGSGYSTFQTFVPSGTSVPGMAGGIRDVQAGVASENPGTFGALTASTAWTALTVAIRTNYLVRHNVVLTNAQSFFAPTILVAKKVQATLHTNVQTFFAPKIKTTIRPALHVNAQEFYGPTINVALTAIRPSLHTNVQEFYPPSILRTIAPPLHTNVQTFFGPKLKMTVKPGARFDNTQSFFAPKITRTVKQSARFDNAQIFYPPAITFAPTPGFVQPPLFTNVQVFFAPTVIVKPPDIVTSLHTNVQQFFGPKIRFTLKAPLHTNVQQFFGANIAIATMVKPPLFTNAQEFYGPRIVRILKPTLHTNVQQFPAGTTIDVLPVGLIKPPLHINLQQFFAPTIIQIPQRPTGGIGAIGPGFWTDSLKDPPGLEKPKKIEEVVWLIPSSFEVPNAAPPWNPVVPQPELERSLLRQRKQMGAYLQNLKATRVRRERQIEDTIISTIVRLLKED